MQVAGVDLRRATCISKMNPTEIVGWVSSGILVLTLGKQVYKQWHEGTSEGVSKWLFVGEIAASLGFTIYSWLVGNMVFVVTNSLLLVNGLLGFGILVHHRKRQQRGASRTEGRKLEAGQQA